MFAHDQSHVVGDNGKGEGIESAGHHVQAEMHDVSHFGKQQGFNAQFPVLALPRSILTHENSPASAPDDGGRPVRNDLVSRIRRIWPSREERAAGVLAGSLYSPEADPEQRGALIQPATMRGHPHDAHPAVGIRSANQSGPQEIANQSVDQHDNVSEQVSNVHSDAFFGLRRFSQIYPNLPIRPIPNATKTVIVPASPNPPALALTTEIIVPDNAIVVMIIVYTNTGVYISFDSLAAVPQSVFQTQDNYQILNSNNTILLGSDIWNCFYIKGKRSISVCSVNNTVVSFQFYIGP